MKTAKAVMALFIVAVMTGCQFGGTTELPAELMGSWKTSNPKYADRLLKFTDSEIHFGIGRGQFTTYTICKVKASDLGHQSTKYVIHYQNQDKDDFIFAFIYTSAHKGSIMVNHQEAIWRKTATSATQ